MASGRPLIQLFLMATLALDLVFSIANEVSDFVSIMKLGLILGQLAALAIWAIRGHMHRLARISCLVVAVGLLTSMIDIDPSPKSIWVTFHAVYALLVVMGTGLCDYVGHRIGDDNQDGPSARRWQVSLIECFGWTIVVAMISYGVRDMNFGFFHLNNVVLLAALLAVPICVPLFFQRNVCEMKPMRVVVWVLISIVAAIVVGNRAPVEFGSFVVLFQLVYLVLWIAVQYMDNTQQHPQLNEILIKEKSLVENPMGAYTIRLHETHD